MEEMTLDQQKALAIASARLRSMESQDSGVSAPKNDSASASDVGYSFAHGANKGISYLLGLPVDTAENIVNLGIAAYGSAMNASGRPDLAPDTLRGTLGGSESIMKGLNAIGVGTENLKPNSAASRMAHTVGKIVGPSLVAPGSTLRSAAVAAAGGAVAGETLGPEWEGVGAVAPAAIGVGVASVRAANARRAQDFKDLGVQPSAGQVTDSTFLQTLENVLGKIPGASGVMRKFLEKQNAALASNTKTGIAAEDAGRAVERGVGSFMDETSATHRALESKLSNKIGANFQLNPARTLQTLDDLTNVDPRAPKITASLVNPKLQAIRDGLADDIANTGGRVPYEVFRRLRTKVGAMLDDALSSDIPNGELKALYGAMSDDLGTAAQQAGAGSEFRRMNAFWRARMDRVENVLGKVLGKSRQPEDIFNALVPKDASQVNKLRLTMRSLPASDRKVVTDAIVDRLGKATAGNQNELGDAWSAHTFMTNWNKLGGAAKQAVFPNDAMRLKMDQMARVANQVKTSAKLGANPSGTAQNNLWNWLIFGAGGGALAAFNPSLFAGAASGVGISYITAKMLTSPKIVNWLTKPVNVSNGNDLAAHIARLYVIFKSEENDAVRDDLGRFIDDLQEKIGK